MKNCPALLTIGPYTLDSTVLLAPMAGITDAPFRHLCLAYGAGLATSEMVAANTGLWHRNKSRLRLVHNNKTAPVSIQIFGSEPAQLAEAARKCADNGAQIIDINMGCPMKKVCRKAAGSALLKDETLVGGILQAVVAAVDIPVTLKIRTGWDRDSINAVTIARIAEASGIKAVAIHGRTRACRFNGTAEYRTIAEVKQAVTIPVIANGDIDSITKALYVKKLTGADAIMIGRAALGQPWLFRQASDVLANRPVREPDFEHKIQCMRDHVVAMHSFYGERQGVHIARKHVASYLEKMGFEKKCRHDFNTIEHPTQQLLFIEALSNNILKGKIA